MLLASTLAGLRFLVVKFFVARSATVEEEGRIEFDFKVERRRHGMSCAWQRESCAVNNRGVGTEDDLRCDHDVVLHMTPVSRCSTYSSLDAALHQINVGDLKPGPKSVNYRVMGMWHSP